MANIVIQQTEITVLDFFSLPDLDTIPLDQIIPVVSNPPVEDPERPLEPQYPTAIPTELIATVAQIEEAQRKIDDVRVKMETIQSQSDVLSSSLQAKQQSVASVEAESLSVLQDAIDIYGSDVWDGITRSGTFDGSGTIQSPYLVDSCAKFIALFSNADVADGAVYRLTKSLDFNYNDLTITSTQTKKFIIYGGNNLISNAHLNIHLSVDFEIYDLQFENITVSDCIFSISSTNCKFQGLRFENIQITSNASTIVTSVKLTTGVESAKFYDVDSSVDVNLTDEGIQYIPICQNTTETSVEFYGCSVSGTNIQKNPVGFAVSQYSTGFGNIVSGEVKSTDIVSYTLQSDLGVKSVAIVDYTYPVKNILVEDVSNSKLIDFNYAEQRFNSVNSVAYSLVETNRVTNLQTSVVIKTSDKPSYLHYDNNNYTLSSNCIYKFTFIQVAGRSSLNVLREVTEPEIKFKMVEVSTGTVDYWNGKQDSEFIAGTGSSTDPFKIATCAQWLLLQKTKFNSTVYVDIIADLIFSSVKDFVSDDKSVSIVINGNNHKIVSDNYQVLKLFSTQSIIVNDLTLVGNFDLPSVQNLFNSGSTITLSNVNLKLSVKSNGLSILNSVQSVLLNNVDISLVSDNAYQTTVAVKSAALNVVSSKLRVTFEQDTLKNSSSLIELTSQVNSSLDGLLIEKHSSLSQVLVKGAQSSFIKSVINLAQDRLVSTGEEINTIRSDCKDNLITGSSVDINFTFEPIRGDQFNIWFDSYLPSVESVVYVNSIKSTLVDSTWNTLLGIPHYGYYKLTYQGNNQFLVEN